MGFTLLEMLGVMAVMAILASVAVPPMLRSLQNAQSVNEDKNLEEIGRALCEAIKAEGQVPNPGALATDTTLGSKGWVAMAAPYCSMASEAIQYVYPGRTETERRFYILTLFGSSLTPTLSKPASYAVPATGWIDDPAVGLEYWDGIKTSFLVLISSSKPDYLLACPANSGTATYTTWADLPGSPGAVRWAKEWVKQAVSGVYSATETQIVDASWTDKGQFLHVKVIPMNNLICETTFSGVGSSFGINSTAVNPIPSVAPLSRFTTRGATVNVDNAGVIRTASATSSALNFVYVGGGTPRWDVNP
jgi:prepilin-type N-terminal cleavage/methylation domain-containing protein